MTAIDTAKALIFTGGTIPGAGASAGDLSAEIAAREAADDALRANGGKTFRSRDEAVASGQAQLPGAIGIVVTLESGVVVWRVPFQNTDDPLFETSPFWGAVARVDAAAAMRDAGVMTLANIGGTADAITAELPSAATRNGVTATSSSSIVEIIPALTNTGASEPTLSIDGGAPVIIKSETGAALTAGQLIGNRSYFLRRRASTWRIISGGVAMADLLALSVATATAGRTASILSLTNVVRTGDDYTADLATDARGQTLTTGSKVKFLPAAANAGAVTLTIGGVTYQLRTQTGSVLPPNTLGGTAPVIAEVVTGTTMRLIGVTQGQHDTLADRVAAVEPFLRTVTNLDGATNRSTATYVTPGSDVVFNPSGEGGVIIKAPPSNGNVALVNAKMSVRRRGNAVVQTMYLSDGSIYEKEWLSGVEGAWVDKTPYSTPVRSVVNAAVLGLGSRDFNVLTELDTTYTADGSALFYNMPVIFDTVGGADGTGYPNGQWQTFDHGPMLAQYYWHTGQPDYAPTVRYHDKDGGTWSDWVRPVAPIASGPALLVLGDSISAGVGVGANDPDGYALRTAALLNSPITRLATAGRAMCGVGTGDLIPAIDLPDNAAAISAAEIIWIAYGTNDWGSNQPIGTESDTENGTFFGAMAEGLTKLRALNVTAKITFMTPIYRGQAYSDPPDWSEAGVNSLGLHVEDYRAAIRRFCALNDIPVVEMSANAEINEATAPTYLPGDQLHPGRFGHRWMSDRFVQVLKFWGWV